jgi:hypothetical protein
MPRKPSLPPESALRPITTYKEVPIKPIRGLDIPTNLYASFSNLEHGSLAHSKQTTYSPYIVSVPTLSKSKVIP